MNFGDALEKLKLGFKIKRTVDSFGYFYLDYLDELNGNRNWYLLYLEAKDKIFCGLEMLEANDLIADDWKIFTERLDE